MMVSHALKSTPDFSTIGGELTEPTYNLSYRERKVTITIANYIISDISDDKKISWYDLPQFFEMFWILEEGV